MGGAIGTIRSQPSSESRPLLAKGSAAANAVQTTQAPGASSSGIDVIAMTKQRLASVDNMDMYIDTLNELCKDIAKQPLPKSQEVSRNILHDETKLVNGAKTWEGGETFALRKKFFLSRLSEGYSRPSYPDVIYR